MSFEVRDGIQRAGEVTHREQDFPEEGFATLLRMQREHFWYRGRGAVVREALRREFPGGLAGKRALDLGGGCGGWVEALHRAEPGLARLALADSSLQALEFAGPVIGDVAERVHVDLLDLPWREAWDVVFLLDVIEHLDDDARALREAAAALAPGGRLLITTPAFPWLWSYNDELAGHKRRYRRRDYPRLAAQAGLELVRADYFMFLLGPALAASRLRPRRARSRAELEALVERQHQVPPAWLNGLLGRVFASEARLLPRVRLPWGTSVLAVLRKPS